MTQQQIPDAERIPSQVVEDAVKGLQGKARWEMAAKVGEDWGYGAGWDEGMRKKSHGVLDDIISSHAIQPQWMNCDAHCWCAYSPEDFPHWAPIIEAMKVTPHDHGDRDTCTSCMLADGRATVSVGPIEITMMVCPGCGGSGKMDNGSQCKRCYGATVVKAAPPVPAPNTDPGGAFPG